MSGREMEESGRGVAVDTRHVKKNFNTSFCERIVFLRRSNKMVEIYNEIMIRRFAPEDFQQIVEIEEEAFSEHNSLVYMNFYEMVGDGFLVAEQDGKVVGYVVGYRSAENEGHIFSVGVKREYQAEG